jgi:glutamate synthase (NADPH/NADH) large chain
VYDPQDAFGLNVNPDSVVWQRVQTPYWESQLKALVETHAAQTKSPLAARLLNDWDREVQHFWQVVPKEMLARLPQPLVFEVANEQRA